MRVSPKLIVDTINEGLETPKILLKESFELWLCDKSGAFVVVFILSLSEANKTIKEWDCKQGTIYSNGTRGFETVFTLLIEVITFYVKLTIIGFWYFRLK